MSELAKDLTEKAALVKAKAEVQRHEIQRKDTLADLADAGKRVTSRKSDESALQTRIDDVAHDLASLDAQAAGTDPDNEPGLLRISHARSVYTVKLLSLQGALERARAETSRVNAVRAKLQADVEQIEQALVKAKDRETSYAQAVEEARQLEAGGARAQAIIEKRAREAEGERTRRVTFAPQTGPDIPGAVWDPVLHAWTFAPGVKKPSPSAAETGSWGLGSAEKAAGAGRDKSPVTGAPMQSSERKIETNWQPHKDE